MIKGTADFVSFVFKKKIRISDAKIHFLSVSLTIVKSDPLSETRLTGQQRKNQSLFPQTFAEHFFIYNLI